MTPDGQRLCRLADLPVGVSKGIVLQPAGRYADLIVVRTATGCFAYRNCCPHTGAPLEWEPDRFLDVTGTLIQCGLHGALFRIEDGYCLAGPCAQQRLQAVAVTEQDGWLVSPEPLARLERNRG